MRKVHFACTLFVFVLVASALACNLQAVTTPPTPTPTAPPTPTAAPSQATPVSAAQPANALEAQVEAVYDQAGPAVVHITSRLILPQIATLEQSLQVIKGMALWAVALAVLTQVLSYVGSGFLLRAIVAVVGQRLSVLDWKWTWRRCRVPGDRPFRCQNQLVVKAFAQVLCSN